MTKLDLKDAYLSIAIHPQSQKYLRFIRKSKTYLQFRALPLQMNIARWVFTRLLKQVAGYLRRRAIPKRHAYRWIIQELMKYMISNPDMPSLVNVD